MLNAALESGTIETDPVIDHSTATDSSRKPSTPNYNRSTNSQNQHGFHLNMLNSDSPFAAATRSIYIGNLPLGCTIRDICDTVRGERGLESVRLLPGKSCAFVDFISRTGGERFIARVRKSRSKPQINGHDIKLGWAKEKPLQLNVGKAIENGATRNIYLSFPPDPSDTLLSKFNDYLRDSRADDSSSFQDRVDYFTTEDVATVEITNLDHPFVSFLYGIYDEFGPVDMIKVVPARRIAFVHMAQVSDAMRAVAELPVRPEFKGKKLSFGRDRCGERMPEPVNGAVTSETDYPTDPNSIVEFNDSQSQSQSHSHSQSHSQLSALTHPFVSRTVYLGGCSSPETTIEDICDQIHAGQLQSVRLNSERRCAFVTFIKAEAAESFLGRALQFGLVIRNCQVKPAFAKESTSSSGHSTNSSSNVLSSTTLPVAIANALRKGYTRNLYLGNVDFSVLTESRLRSEMSRFGPLDRIQLLKDRGVAFVHFANLLDGGKAFEQVKSDLCYKNCRVGFGKDRCEPAVTAAAAATIPQGPNSSSRPSPQSYPNTPANYYYPPPPFNLYYHPMMYDPTSVMYPPPPPPPPSQAQAQAPAPYNKQQLQEDAESTTSVDE